MILREFKSSDCELLFKWANDALVRKNAFSGEPIQWDSHCEWFKSSLENENCIIYILTDDVDKPLGQIRFDMVNLVEAEIDYSIDSEERNKGLSKKLLEMACKKIFTEKNITRICAYVKNSNVSSIRAFNKSNFVLSGNVIRENSICKYFTCEKFDPDIDNNTYIVATSKRWHEAIFFSKIQFYPGNWYFVSDEKSLTSSLVQELRPTYIFFPHWSSIVQPSILNLSTCICFHSTDVPFGRGGSPIQNLIEAGYDQTVITALKMTSELDAGPVYLKKYLSLEGLADEIFIRSSDVISEMIREIVLSNPVPIEQSGKPFCFKRRVPSESEISDKYSLETLFDKIRMLDAEGYPYAYMENESFRFEFTRPALKFDKIVADVCITKKAKCHDT